MWEELAPYAVRAPSPHNTQPVRLRIVDDTHAQLWFVRARGLPVGDPEGRFTHLAFGIFAESLRIAAHARAHQLDVTATVEDLYAGDEAVVKVADLRLVPAPAAVDDHDPELLLRRRTNRHPYNERPLPAAVRDALHAEADGAGHRLAFATDADAIRWVKELNRDALYHDLEDPAYREELGTWLRYSPAAARRRRDGLSAGALAVPGPLLKGVMRAHALFTAPGFKQVTQYAYLRTMKGISTVAWVQGDFVDAADWQKAGRLMLRLWVVLTAHGIDWQPYGSVITKPEARAAMVDKFGMREGQGGRDMVWLLVRMGYCDHQPVRSLRLPVTEVVV